METMLINGHTHPGLRRKENQDAYIFRQLWSDDKALLAVIDGVGGYAGGEKAATIARDCIDQYMQLPKGDTLTMLREAVIFANNRIVEERNANQQLSEMCCVLTAVVADTTTGYIYYAHVGDTRLYRYRNGLLQKITRDHSFVGIREDAGEMSELEAMRHPHRNQILREVGSATHRLDDEDFIDYGADTFMPGDIFLLCSDGLTDMITLQQMTTILSATQPLPDKVNDLIALANEMGGHDNITVLLLQHQLTARQVKDGPVIASPANEAEVLPAKKTKKKRIPESKRWMLWTILAFVLVAGGSWYFSPSPQSIMSPLNHASNTRFVAIDSNETKPATRVSHAAVPGPAATLKTDTLRISGTQNLLDLRHYTDSTGGLLVLVPAKSSQQRFAAVEINAQSAKPGDTLEIKNLRLKDFETGFNVRVPVVLKTNNLVFENTKYPFTYLFKPDSNHASVLFMNNEKR
jgi:PPM family protein phosphatase